MLRFLDKTASLEVKSIRAVRERPVRWFLLRMMYRHHILKVHSIHSENCDTLVLSLGKILSVLASTAVVFSNDKTACLINFLEHISALSEYDVFDFIKKVSVLLKIIKGQA